MRRSALALVVLVAACSGGDADTTTSAPAATTTTSTVAPTTSPSTTPSTTTSTTSTTTTTVPVPDGFVTYEHPSFTLAHPDAWSENPEYPGAGVGFIEDHSALALPPTTFSIFIEEQEPGFDLDEHIQRLQDELAGFVPDFRVLRSGEGTVDGERTVWFEYADDFTGFAVVVREEAGLHDDVLYTFTLNSPEEFFEFDVDTVDQLLEGFRFV